MADETTVDPQGSRRLFFECDDIAADLETARLSLESIRSTIPEPWGNDRYGKQFAQQCEGNAQLLLGYVADAIDFMGELGREGRGAIANFVATDEDNASGVSAGNG